MSKTIPSAKTPPAKERLLQAAIKIFADEGYEAASTRRLASAAKVNISAIPYYFKGKEGLYGAVLAFIAGKVQAEMAAKAAHVRQALEGDVLSDQEYRELAHDLFSSFIRFLLDEDLSPSLARIFMREQVEPTQSFNMFYETTMRPMHETLTRLVARLTGLAYPGEEATLCAHAILGTVTVFKTHRALLLRRLAWETYRAKEVEKVTRVVLKHLDAVVDAYRQEKGVEA